MRSQSWVVFLLALLAPDGARGDFGVKVWFGSGFRPRAPPSFNM